ncbi:NDR1/HIN1-like protein [Dyadobacter psychrotolerans]|uniref:Late embryogenesis abundant protein LEA-2 subgroup domain-containing protein n=1 Tax=Dyadobacter psychrotolerans TaxID=2541721 RepID=A0A4V2Z452_9BACT|nr:LEA type 2 family protein [Dyadobacter psychrotolerans]TDE15288.1 hypothetical protein E0F88_12250 [Dyadobacter psychrotolerans]
MKKEKKILITACIVALVFVILQKRRAFQSLSLTPGLPRNFRIQGINEIFFELPIRAFNASDGTLNIGSIDLLIWVENQNIGQAYFSSSQKILPYGPSELRTIVRTSFTSLAAAIPGFANGLKDQVLDIRLKGRLNVEGFYVNVDIPVSFNLPRLR